MQQRYAKILTALSKLSLIEIDFSAFCASTLYTLSTLGHIHAAAIYVPSPYPTRLTLQQASDRHPSGPMPAAEDDQARYVINSMRPVIIPDMQAEERFSVWQPLLASELRSAMLARYHTLQGNFGLLAVYSTQPAAFDTELEEFMQTAANMIALALEHSSMAVTRSSSSLDYISDMAVIIGRDWYYAYANQAASRATRTRKRDLIGQSVVELYTDILPEHLAIYERVMAERRPQRFRANHILPMGVRGEYDVQLHPIPEGILLLAQPAPAENAFNEREQRLLAETMQDIALVLNATLDRTQVLRQILTQAERVVPHQAASIILAHGTGYDVISPESEHPLFTASAHASIVDMVEQGDTFLLRDRAAEATNLPLAGWVASFVGVPIHLDKAVIGFLCIGSPTAGDFSLPHARRLYIYAAQCAVALWNARLYENERRERQLAQTLQETARMLSSPDHLDAMLNRVLEQVQRVVAFNWGALWLVDGPHLTLGAFTGGATPPATTLPIEDTSLLSQTLHEAIPLTRNVPHVQAITTDGIVPSTQVWAGIPLIHREATVGLLSVGRFTSQSFTPEDINALTGIGRQAALAIINALMVAELEAKVSALQQARDSAARSARLSAMGEMAMGIAHQINNPLTAVIAQASLAERHLPADHPALRSVQAISRAANRAAGIVKRMFDLGRVTDYDMIPVDITTSITDTAALVRAQLDPTHTTLLLDLPDDFPTISGSPQHLEDVWINLMLNARDAVRDRNDGEIIARAEVTPQHISVTITDNGVGIPADQLEQVFTPFFTTKPHGTGLGLAICYEVITKHGGTIHVTSQEGHGTTFTIHLPYPQE